MSALFSFNSLVIIALSILPGLVWLNFYLKQDKRPEPLQWLLLVFCIGAFMTFPAAYLEHYLDWLFNFKALRDTPLASSYHFWNVFVFLFLAAAVEEILKFLGVFVSAFQNKKIFNESVDAMIYLIVAAIGFSTSENLMYSSTSLSGGAFYLLFVVAFIRFVGATFMHTLSSGLVGYGLGWSTFYGHRSKLLYGFIAAILLHTFYNFLIILNAWLFAFIIFGLFLVGIIVLHEFNVLKIKSGQYIDSENKS